MYVMAKATTKAVVKKETGLPNFLKKEDLGYTGYENTTQESFSLPFIQVLDKSSPQVLEEGDQYIEGAKPGKLFHTLTKKVFTTLDVIPVYYERCFNEWEDKTNAFKGKHSVSEAETITAERNGLKRKSVNGHHLVETHQFYCLLPAYLNWGIVVVSFKSTGIKHARNWMTQMSMITFKDENGDVVKAPIFYNSWKLRTGLNKNERHTWYTYGVGSSTFIDRVGWVTAEQFAYVKSAVEMLNSRDLSTVVDTTDSPSREPEEATVIRDEDDPGF